MGYELFVFALLWMCLMTCGKGKKAFKKSKEPDPLKKSDKQQAHSINIKSPPSRRGKNSKRSEFKDDLDKDKDGDVKPDKVPSEKTGVKPKSSRMVKLRYRQGHKTREDSVKIRASDKGKSSGAKTSQSRSGTFGKDILDKSSLKLELTQASSTSNLGKNNSKKSNKSQRSKSQLNASQQKSIVKTNPLV
ncbi:hypothetical protein WR25_01226 [Diploscapter pachys]|uniref:Uncharacterized protein n=1 Tax=Diploscapter pachys TaxID=2018661 RepID=A0A2A2KPW0_9BILA|nr:hypothetical protein WR25_01226 [Diploscapter pachys]